MVSFEKPSLGGILLLFDSILLQKISMNPMMEKTDFVSDDDTFFVPHKVIKVFNAIYNDMKEAQRMLHHVVGAGSTLAQIRDTEIWNKKMKNDKSIINHN